MAPKRGWVIACFLALLAACDTATDPPSAGNPATTISLGAAGLSPTSLQLSPGSTVTFENDDGVEHLIRSDPYPADTDCPELNVQLLSPAMSQTATMGSTPKTCGFHDDLHATDTAFQGSIVVKAVTTYTPVPY